MKITHIVACAENGTIGRDGALPWHLPEDLKFFKKITSGHIVIMGRKTYESIGKPLPNRFNIIISRQVEYSKEGATTVASLDEAFSLSSKLVAEWGDEVFVMGGGEIYRQSLPLVGKIYMTKIHKTVSGDTNYPLDALTDFAVVSEETHSEGEMFSFLAYQRKTP